MLTIAKVYDEFFRSTKNERIVLLKGGRRSGKTYALFFRFLVIAEQGSGGLFLITAPTYPILGKLVSDFRAITGKEPKGTKDGGFTAIHFNGIFRFETFDNAQKARGVKCKDLWVNEASGYEKEIFDELAFGVERQIFCDYNPSIRFWATELENVNNCLTTTFRDNKYLTKEQIKHFEEVEERGMNARVGSYEWKLWQNEVLGNYAEMGGNIFNNVYEISQTDYDKIDAIETLGLDFGDTRDPNCLVGVKYFNNCMYVRYYFKETAISDSYLAEVIAKIQKPKQKLIYETATGGNTRIVNILQNKNIKVTTIPVIKQSVTASVLAMCDYEKIFVCNDTDHEFANYKIVNGVLSDKDNHGIDAARYVDIMTKLS